MEANGIALHVRKNFGIVQNAVIMGLHQTTNAQDVVFLLMKQMGKILR